MDKELLTSRFFKSDDKRMDKVVFPLPSHWWSRFYEYAWASEFCKETDIVLDAACGIAHPFKFYLSDKCKCVYAIDKDERILDIEAIKYEIEKTFLIHTGVEECLSGDANFKQGDITALPYRNGMFDKIFCISVLEHLSDEDKLKALISFRKALKNTGMVILTLDYPDTNVEVMEKIVFEAGFKLAGEKDSTAPQNAINWNRQLYCFRMALVKKKEGE